MVDGVSLFVFAWTLSNGLASSPYLESCIVRKRNAYESCVELGNC